MTMKPRPPRDNLIRARAGIQMRAADDDAPPVIYGYMYRLNEWTEIDSLWEGRFMERIAPGAGRKTLREGKDSIRCCFEHGMDPQVGNKPLGPFEVLSEDNEGGYYEVPALDAPYVRDTVLPGIRAGLYGASFRFRVLREEIVDEPDRSDYNPNGLAERTIKEMAISEGGPVTFPAYAGATAHARSMTDDFIMRCMAQDPERLRAMFQTAYPLGDPQRGPTFTLAGFNTTTSTATNLPVRSDAAPDTQPSPPAESHEEPQVTPGPAGREAAYDGGQQDTQDTQDSSTPPEGQPADAPSTSDAGRKATSLPERRDPILPTPPRGDQSIFGSRRKESKPAWLL